MKAIQMEKVKDKDILDCTHSSLLKEYHLGAATGDYICAHCGKSGFGRDWVNYSSQMESD